jgi:hypothetical protein
MGLKKRCLKAALLRSGGVIVRLCFNPNGFTPLRSRFMSSDRSVRSSIPAPLGQSQKLLAKIASDTDGLQGTPQSRSGVPITYRRIGVRYPSSGSGRDRSRLAFAVGAELLARVLPEVPAEELR